MKGLGEHTTVVLNEMCRRVKADYEKINFSKKDWFKDYEWTEDEQDEFEKWLIDYTYNNTKARRELTTITTKNKRQCKRFAEFFCFDYGWRLK